jgi:hypothetical protein
MAVKRAAAWWGVLVACGLAGCAALPGRCGPEDEERRAGHPSDVAPWAQPSDTGRYRGCPVGGGAPWHGDAPGPDEGTWGWDYCGGALPSCNALRWYHGRREQGGTGAYRTDGPRVLERCQIGQ